jgi:hypothetical protein
MIERRNVGMSKYLYSVDEVIDTKTGQIIILEQTRVTNGKSSTRKGYVYQCIIDGYINTTSESELKRGTGCPVCSNIKTLKGINDISTTHPHLIKYFKNIEDTYLHTYGERNKIWIRCPDCGLEREIKIIDLCRNGFSCKKCGDKIPYPEKFAFSVLEQLGLDFQTQLSKKDFEWCGDYRYDFYFKLNDEDFVIETHGKQHYEECTGNWEVKLKEQQLIDKNKKELALDNGIKEENYIVIDCRESNVEWIKNSILNNSKINIKFNISIIDWNKCAEFACSNRIKEICNYRKINPNISVLEISKITKIERTTVTNFLKQGHLLNWCNYNPQEESQKSGIKHGRDNGIKSSKSLKVFKNDIFIGKFYSAKELERQSEKIFGYKVGQGTISKLCKSNKLYKGEYVFKYA